ncbi:MAG: class II fructose-bisphosphate aldolase [Chloroflexi bacterium]|nr:class II fructose-bisphosphate aldolase [Chloroflexota bacterium]MCL5273586.1 class II fructose-bisphosphate aldolase [Chloroflexota bacterium]
MSIVPFIDLLERAVRKHYAIGYYESWDQYSLEAAIEAAEESQSPAILGFGGAVTNQGWLDRYGVEELSGLATYLAEHSSVPTAVLFNEARTLSQVLQGLHAGCNAVMLDTSHLPFEENLAWTRKVAEAAHPLGAAVEAELGRLADGTDPRVQAAGTHPQEATIFVAQSGVDALAVSIGNVHILTDGEARVNIELLETIHRAVRVPLVIHGGTGYPASAVRAAIEHGVAKFNVGTRLKQVYLAGIKEAIEAMPEKPNVHLFVGSRETDDVFARGKKRLKDEIIRYIHLYGSAGMASS